MDLRLYPLDKQVCVLQIASCKCHSSKPIFLYSAGLVRTTWCILCKHKHQTRFLLPRVRVLNNPCKMNDFIKRLIASLKMSVSINSSKSSNYCNVTSQNLSPFRLTNFWSKEIGCKSCGQTWKQANHEIRQIWLWGLSFFIKQRLEKSCYIHTEQFQKVKTYSHLKKSLNNI